MEGTRQNDFPQAMPRRESQFRRLVRMTEQNNIGSQTCRMACQRAAPAFDTVQMSVCQEDGVTFGVKDTVVRDSVCRCAPIAISSDRV